MKRIGEPWVAGRPYRDRIGVYGLLPGHDGRLLCVHQRGVDAEEMQLPGGGIDPGEQPLAALHREVREETGWLIGAPRRIATFQSYTWLWDYRYWARKVHMIYLARAVRRLGPPLEAGHTPHWLAPEVAARALDVAGDREMVLRAMARGLI
jgi:8-oxo-dGTP diphosphatase